MGLDRSDEGLIECVGGPQDGKWVSPVLGRKWPFAVLVNYGSRMGPDGHYGHLVGWYHLEWGHSGDGEPIPKYSWGGVEQSHCE